MPLNLTSLSFQIARVCGERDKRSLFRGWIQLRLYAAAINATCPAYATTAATGLAATVNNAGKEVAAGVEPTRVGGTAGVASLDAARLLEKAEEAERALEKQRRQDACRMVMTKPQDRVLRFLAHGMLRH